MAGIPHEIEAKLLVGGESELRKLAQLTQVGRYRFRPRDVQKLRSVYLDTPALSLARHGVALRVRRAGDAWEATAKWSGSVAGDIHERAELTVTLPHAPPTPFTLPAGPLATHLTALIAGRPLRPILITEIHRRRIDIVTPDDGARPVAELALDRVHLRAPTKFHPRDDYYEVEIELRRGSRRDLSRLVQLLRRRCALQASVESKFARGLRLFHGTLPRFAGAPTPVAMDDTVESAARKIVTRNLTRLRLRDPDTRLGKDPEAVHDVRVATRRLRASLRAFKPGFRRAFRTYLSEELTWLAQQLGGVRDLDVQLATLERFCADLPVNEQSNLLVYRTHLEAARRQQRRTLLAALGSSRYLRLLAELEAFAIGDARYRPHKHDAHQPVATMGRRAIRKTFRKLLQQGDAIAAAPTAEDLHALRIRAKRARYLLEFLRDLTDRPGRRLVKQLVRLQDQLGAHQDAMVAVDTVRRYREVCKSPPPIETERLLERFTSNQLQQAEQICGEFNRTWRRFSQKRVKNDLRAALEHLRFGEIALRPSPAENDASK